MHADYRMTSTEWALLALLSLLWGGSFFFAKVAVQALPPLTVVLARVALAAVALGLYLRWRGAPLPRSAALWRTFAGMGLLNNLVPFTLLWDKVVLEPLERPPFDAAAFWATLDRLGARDFLPDGLPEDPPVEPDEAITFD